MLNMEILRKKEKLNPKDARKNRIVVLAVLGLTLLATGSVILYRDRREIIGKFIGSETVVFKEKLLSELEPTPTPAHEKEIEEIKNLTANLKGAYGVFVQDLATGESYGLNAKEIFTAASLIKLPVLLTLYKEVEGGNLTLDTKYVLKAADKRGGAGSIQYKPAGTVYTYRQMAQLMGKQSDNTAFNVFSNVLREEKIQMVVNDLGMKNTSFKDNKTTPEDIGLFFYKFYTQNILIRDNRDELLSFITDTIYEDRIPAGVPKGTKVAHKIGNEIGVISDAGIVFAKEPFVLAILSEGVIEKEATGVLPKIAGVVYRQRVGE